MNSPKNWIKLCAISALVAAGSTAHAQKAYDVTVVTQFALSGVKQSDQFTRPVKITNKDILAALNATGRFNFGTGAQIILVSLQDDLPTFSVRQGNGTNAATTDISNYFYITEPGELHSADNLTSYAFQIFTFDNRNGTSFTVSGVTALHRGTVTGPGVGPLSRVKTLSANLSGSGSVDGASIVVRGTVHGGSARAEVAN